MVPFLSRYWRYISLVRCTFLMLCSMILCCAITFWCRCKQIHYVHFYLFSLYKFEFLFGLSIFMGLYFSLMPDKFGAAMVLVKSDIGGNISVRYLFSCIFHVYSIVWDKFFSSYRITCLWWFHLVEFKTIEY